MTKLMEPRLSCVLALVVFAALAMALPTTQKPVVKSDVPVVTDLGQFVWDDDSMEAEDAPTHSSVFEISPHHPISSHPSDLTGNNHDFVVASQVVALELSSETSKTHNNLGTLPAPQFIPIEAHASGLNPSSGPVRQEDNMSGGQAVVGDDVASLRQRLNFLMTQHSQDAVESDLQNSESTAQGCECTTTVESGMTIVPYVGCDRHLEGQPAFCYVAVPAGCVEFSRPSSLYPGASWRFCDYNPQTDVTEESGPVSSSSTHLDHSEEDGKRTYTMKHSGVTTTLVTEGNKTLTGAEQKQRTQQMVEQVKSDQTAERRNITKSLNETQQMTADAMKLASNDISEALDGVMDAVDSALGNAFADAESDQSQGQGAPTFKDLFARINSKVMQRTQHLRPRPKPTGNATVTGNQTETLYDRMMGMSSRIVNQVNHKMDMARAKSAQAAQSASGPVSVSATTQE